ncbi:MAG TPA: MBL fold metallo-hydrolase [Xanthobacteraceae bacterium]|jgi:flavorubredoxin
MAITTEIASNIYRISIFAQWGNLQFNHFLVKDDEPLLFHTGLRGMHAEMREAVSKLIKLSELRHISFSHFESDECGSLNEWLAAAPKADVICSQVGAFVNVNDFIGWESRALTDGGTFATGRYRFRYCRTPHLPHGWDAGVLFEEMQRTLLCSDLFHQMGDVEPLTLRRCRGPLASGDEGISGGHPCGVCPVHTTHGAELEKARRPEAQNARDHAWLKLHR